MFVFLSFFSSGFPIISGRRNGFEYNSSTLSCPVSPPPLKPILSIIYFTRVLPSGFLSTSPSLSYRPMSSIHQCRLCIIVTLPCLRHNFCVMATRNIPVIIKCALRATRPTCFIQGTRSSGSLHISFKLGHLETYTSSNDRH